MKKLVQLFAALTFVSLIVVLTATAAESLSVLLQKGIYAEETEGNLDAAIKIYEGIVKEADASRSLVAQAQYRLGVCELKRGKKEEAESAFRKIVGQFSDQSELIAKARERLSEMGKSASSVIVRQVWSGIGTLGLSVSEDGRYLAFVDSKTENVAVRNLINGQNKVLTDAGFSPANEQFTEQCVFSGDGKQIAYTLADWGRATFASGIRVVGVESGLSRALINQQTNRWWRVEDWSPDGKRIVAINIQWGHEYMPRNWLGTNSQASICLINVADGRVSKLLALGPSSPSSVSNVRFSPDGHYLAYNLSRNGNAGGRVQPTNDVYAVDLQTGVPKIAIEYVAHENLVGWAPRGMELIFTSDRSGTTGLWSVQVNNGDTKPKLLKADVGEIKPIGLTRDGALFYNVASGPLKEFYAASVDFKAGKTMAAPKLFRTSLTRSSGGLGDKASSSGDGRFLFFRSEEKEPLAYIFDVESGQQREIPNSRNWANRIGWWWPQPEDGILFAALSGSENEAGLYKVDTRTGDMAPVAVDRPGVRQILTNPIRFNIYRDFVAYGRLYSNPEKFVLVKYDRKSGREMEYEIPGLAHETIPIPRTVGIRNLAILLSDGRSFFFNRKSVSADTQVLIRHDLLTGEQTEFLTSKSGIGVVDTGSEKMAFFVTADDRERPVFTLFSLEGSELHRQTQVTIPEGFQYRGQHWGEPHLILANMAKPTTRGLGVPAELWTLSVPTGELKNIGLSVANDQFWGLFKDSKRLIFQTSAPRTREVWVMENFLPLAMSSK